MAVLARIIPEKLQCCFVQFGFVLPVNNFLLNYKLAGVPKAFNRVSANTILA